MLNKINKLINATINEKDEVKNSLASIIDKIKDKMPSGKKYLLIDIKKMESQVSPDKVESEEYMEKVEVDL